MEFRVLGPVEVEVEGSTVALGGPQPRALLAALLARRSHVVSPDALTFMLWGVDPPATATKMIQKYVSQLRKQIGSRLITKDGGYALITEADLVDADRFERLIESGSEDDLASALDMWRGDPYPELVDDDVGRAESARLTELRLTADERLIEARIDRGLHAEAVGKLDELITANPYRERLWGLLMLALYGAGRQAEALEAFQRLRRLLGEQLGIEPTAEIKELEERILLQDPSLVSSHPVQADTNLPAPRDSFIGRSGELGRIHGLLSSERLVTLVGPAGSGKTRLGIEVGRSLQNEFLHGVWFVDLAPVRSPDLVVESVAAVLGVGGLGDRPTESVLAQYLARRRLLLIIDNCEHVINKIAGIVDLLLGSAPELKIMTTSRERLGVAGESLVEVLPLPYPALGDSGEGFEAVELFIDRARATAPSQEILGSSAVVGEIVRRLDGMPLAIELAAARVRALGLVELRDRLDDRFSVLSGRDTDERHETLQAAVDWSYRLLSLPDQVLFLRLSVFRGGFTLEAASEVCGFDPLTSRSVVDLLVGLVDKSLVVVSTTGSGRPRYGLLETLRAFGRIVLSDDEARPVRESHAHFYSGMAMEAARHLNGTGQARWLDRLKADHDNLRKALRWAAETDPEMVVRMSVALASFWDSVGPRSEGHEWLSRAVDLSTSLDPGLRIDALLRASDLFSSVNASLPRRYAEQALVLAEELDDPLSKARSLRAFSWALAMQEESDRAVEAGLEALEMFERLDDSWELALCKERLAQANLRRPGWSIDLLRSALELYMETGDRAREALVRYKLADLLAITGDVEGARPLVEEAVGICDSLGNVHDGAHARLEYGKILRRAGETESAVEVLTEALEQLSRSGDERCSVRSLSALGMALIEAGDKHGGAKALTDSLKRARELDEKYATRAAMAGLARLMAASGRGADAVALLAFVDDLGRSLEVPVSHLSRKQRERRLEAIREQIGVESFDRSWERGSAMTIDDAIKLALSQVQG